MVGDGISDAVPFGLPRLACRQGRIAPNAAYADLGLALPAALLRAVPQRQAEFMAGRLCAALALRDLGAESVEVAVNPDRSPCWPVGFVGSISHSGDQVVAVVAKAGDYRRLGVDIEPLMPEAQSRDLAETLLAPVDAAFCPAGVGFAAFVTLVFSAKEAFYKALSADLGRIIGFHEVRLCGIAPGEVRLALVPGLGGAEHRLHYRWADGICLTLLAEPCGG
ncbi:4'-phosphopantetheinyl transferase family protein [Rhodobacter ferrooxidans]|uniref:Enterobactin synthase component D n=1 Tax=Rhodobacter ferrooxidans TaxID=371731 RepID=C8RXD8_9RHOB|nr:4'-phosphopantetheinyl transferase superfamily protein [Rhodobacter sp. SW2]EEW26663.1 4'-phosphopantetheinyl transferase [Rhodobacter sp. SW2]